MERTKGEPFIHTDVQNVKIRQRHTDVHNLKHIREVTAFFSITFICTKLHATSISKSPMHNTFSFDPCQRETLANTYAMMPELKVLQVSVCHKKKRPHQTLFFLGTRGTIRKFQYVFEKRKMLQWYSDTAFQEWRYEYYFHF